MSAYLSYFFETPNQIAVLAGCFAVWMAFAAVGGLLLRGDRLIEADVISGWAVANLVLTLGGVFTGVPYTSMAIGLGLLAAAAFYLNLRDGVRFVAPSLPKLVVLTAPLLLIASAMQGSQWDEFTDWLLIPRYLTILDHLPSQETPYPGAAYPGYPFGWHYVAYFVARLTGSFQEAAAPVFNVLLLLGLATLVVRIVARSMGEELPFARPGWGIAALAALAVTLINPTFAQKIVLTSYAETSTTVATAFAAVLGWLMLDALADADRRRARRLAIQLGLALCVLINLKQATFALFLLLAAAPIAVALRDRLVPLKEVLSLAGYVLIPPLIVYFSWKFHVDTKITGGVFTIRAIEDWFYHLIPTILKLMVIVLAKKGYYLFCVVVITVLGVRAFWRCRGSEDRFLALTAFVIVGYNAFLFFAYLATFPESQAATVASYWRYNMHLGGIVIVSMAAIVASRFGDRIASFAEPKRLGRIAVILIVAAPLVLAYKLRFDKLPRLVHFRAVGEAVGQIMEQDARYFVIDPVGDGESAAAALYETAGKQRMIGYSGAYHPSNEDHFRKIAVTREFDYLLVHSIKPGFTAWFDAELDPDYSYLFKREGDGWREIERWRWPDYRGK